MIVLVEPRALLPAQAAAQAVARVLQVRPATIPAPPPRARAVLSGLGECACSGMPTECSCSASPLETALKVGQWAAISYGVFLLFRAWKGRK